MKYAIVQVCNMSRLKGLKEKLTEGIIIRVHDLLTRSFKIIFIFIFNGQCIPLVIEGK